MGSADSRSPASLEHSSGAGGVRRAGGLHVRKGTEVDTGTVQMWLRESVFYDLPKSSWKVEHLRT